MPKIEVSRSDLFALAGIEDPGDEKLARLLTVAKGELDDSDGDRLKIELNDTNRPDLWCVEGVARALKCHASGSRAHLSNLPPAEDEIRVDPGLRGIRPYVAAFKATGWTLSEDDVEALVAMQEKLAASFGRDRSTAASGFYRLDEITFPEDYIAADPSTEYVPLGCEEKMPLSRVLTETETGRAYAHLLKDAEAYPVLRDDEGRVLSFPPVLNSQDTGRVQAGDSNLFCEVTGTDWETVQLTATILAVNLEDRGAGITPLRVVYSGEESDRTEECPAVHRDTMTATLDRIGEVLGTELDPKTVRNALDRMDYASVTVEGESVTGVLPPYRRDGIHPVDMIEDIAVSRGLSAFEPLLPGSFTMGRSADVEDLSDAVRGLMAGAGCEEILRPVLTSMKKVRDMTGTPEQPVAIANPMTAEYGVVRSSLLPGLLEVESTSGHAAYPHRTFEVGEVLVLREGLCHTRIMLACLVCGNQADFGAVHSIAGHLCHSRGIELELLETEDPRFVPGRCASLLLKGRPAGVIGEVHPEVLENWGITSPAAAMELDLPALKLEPSAKG